MRAGSDQTLKTHFNQVPRRHMSTPLGNTLRTIPSLWWCTMEAVLPAFRFQTCSNQYRATQFFHSFINNKKENNMPLLHAHTPLIPWLRSEHAADEIARNAARQVGRTKSAASEIRCLAELVASRKCQRVDDSKSQRNS